MNENDDPKIRELLKKSPPLTPPESFYQGVLDKIERKHNPATAPTPWYWGVPGRLVASACLVMLVVFVTRDTSKEQLEMKKSPPAAPAMNKIASVESARRTLDKLSESAPVQKRLERSMVDYVDHPSPFEEVDEADRKQLQVSGKDVPMAASSEMVSELKEARDTVGGVVSQNSFMDQQRFRKDAAHSLLSKTKDDAAMKSSEKSLEWLGASSGIVQPRTVVIRTGNEWKTLWQEHSHSVPPRVDFDQQMVIGIFGGEKHTSGYNLEIVSISEGAAELVVSYREGPPSLAQVMTQPYVLRVVPKSNLPFRFQKIH